MEIKEGLHLSYCSNIHPGESWREVFSALKENIPPIKINLSPDKPFGIGLRLSALAASELNKQDKLEEFTDWLKENKCYVFTMNGFVFGGFHNRIVKDNVYRPDWAFPQRVNYTMELIQILAHLIPPGSEAGISTSPISYKPWIKHLETERKVLNDSSMYLAYCVKELYLLKAETGKYIHLDIEPEPGCLLENSTETVKYFEESLIPVATKVLMTELKLSKQESEALILEHINVCYDVCHFAVEYEDHDTAIRSFQDAGIHIGKIQISSALKVLTGPGVNREKLQKKYSEFAESTYLHQTIAKDLVGRLHHFDDLPLALENFKREELVEWRTHYHVPVFMEAYGELSSTRDDIIKVLDILKRERFTNHLEVETYTWEVLPRSERLELKESIIREMKWVMECMNRK